VAGAQFSTAPKAMLIYTVLDGELKTIFPIFYLKKFEYAVVGPLNFSCDSRFDGRMAAFFSARTGMPCIPLVEKDIDPIFHCCICWEIFGCDFCHG